MKKLIFILLLTIGTAHAARFEVELHGGVELRVENSYEQLEAAGKNPKFLMLTLDVPSLSYTTADYSSGTDYTPPSGRVFHVKGIQTRTSTAADMEFLLCTSTTPLPFGSGGCINSTYYLSGNGSGYPRTMKCDNVAVCIHNVSNLTIPSGRYLALDMTSGTGRSGQVFGYEADE